MRIVFTGAQGVGKTTLLDIMEKCLTYTTDLEFVRNFTRNIAKTGLNINKNGTASTQLSIMKAHKDIVSKKDNFVMDRCILDGLVYTIYLHRSGRVDAEVLNECEELFQQCIGKYDIIFYIRPEFPVTGDDYRSADESYRDEIADIFEELIEKYKVPVISVSGTVGDRLKTVQDVLRKIHLLQEGRRC